MHWFRKYAWWSRRLIRMSWVHFNLDFKLFASPNAMFFLWFEIIRVDELVLERAHIRNVLHWASDRITSLNQLVEGNLSFLWILPKIKNDDIHAELLESLIAQLEKGDFDKQNLLALLQEFSKKNDLKFSKFMRSLRATLSGISDGPGVAEIMAILGKKVTISRFRKNLPKKNNRESAEQKWWELRNWHRFNIYYGF